MKLTLKHYFILGVFAHLLAVFFSEGYHRPDEHLGLMRFMTFKLGLFPIDELSWEYPAKIRPWLQPGLMVVFSKIYLALGFKDPFIWATILRFISSALALYSSVLLARLAKAELQGALLKIAYALIFLTWYFPFFHARPSAENWGMSFFLIGLCYWLLSAKFSRLAIGLLLGASFIVRFQMAFAIAPLWFWFIYKKREGAKGLTLVALGIVLAIALNLPLDYWGYGEWTFSAWNYFDHNILRGAAAGFGVAPWYYYVTKIFSKGIPPLSLFFLVPTAWCWIKRRDHWVTWITLPFFVLHSMVGHKELRFLFGMGMLCPHMLALMLEDLKLKWTPAIKYFCYLVIAINSVALIIASTKPAFTPIDMYKVLYSHSSPPRQMITFGEFRDQLSFYLQAPIKQIQVEDQVVRDLQMLASKHLLSGDAWFLTDKFSDIELLQSNEACRAEYLGYPQWILELRRYSWARKILTKSKTWGLYSCHFPKKSLE